jgi:quercetin dioxygenase-like cupin family protein
MIARATLCRWDDVPLEKITEMVARKAVSVSDLGLMQAYFKKGAVVPRHQRDSDVAVYVLQGAMRFLVAGVPTTVREGEVLVIPAGAWHQSESLDDTFVMTFTASRVTDLRVGG